MNTEAPQVAQINAVGVILEDLLFGERVLQVHRDQGLGNLAAPASLLSQPQRARKLLRERGGALRSPPLLRIHPGRAKNTRRIEAPVMKEAFVLGGEDGIHQHFRDLAPVNKQLFFAAVIEEVRDDFGLQRKLSEAGVVRGETIRATRPP